MKKVLISFAMTLFLYVNALSQQIYFLDASYKSYDLNSPAQKVITSIYQAKDSMGVTVKGKLLKYAVTTFENGKVKNKTQFDADGNLKEKSVYILDGKRVSKIKNYDAQGNPTNFLFFNIDTAGDVWKITLVAYSHKLDMELNGGTFYYNPSEDIIYLKQSGIMKLAGQNLNRLIIKNPGCKSLILVKLDNKEKFTGLQKNELNNKTLVIKEKHYNETLKPVYEITYSYQYDDKGSWIKRIKYKNGVPVEITERTIVYE